MGERWTEIQQVPVGAFFRYKTRPKDIFPIEAINLQYAGGMSVPGLDIKATPAVRIELQWWRLQELGQMFDYSFDCVNWHDCSGAIAAGASDVKPPETPVDKKKS